MKPSAKSALRERIRDVLRSAPEDQRRALSIQLCDVLREQTIWTQAQSVLLFAPLPDEPDIAPLIDEALDGAKSVRFPQYDAAIARYVACQINSRSDLAAGRFGVLEPASGCPVVPLNQLDLALVPGVAFDLTGRRLGRGKGFYDRLLAEVRGHKCGICFDAQIVPEVPAEPHDVRLDSILTPTRWHLCQRAA